MNTEIINKGETCADTFYCIHSWMRTELLIDNLIEASIYAIIYGYYKQNKQFYGELKYLQELCFCKESSITKYLGTLLQKGLVVKTKIYQNGYIQRYSYDVAEDKLPVKYRRINQLTNLYGEETDKYRLKILNRNTELSDITY